MLDSISDLKRIHLETDSGVTIPKTDAIVNSRLENVCQQQEALIELIRTAPTQNNFKFKVEYICEDDTIIKFNYQEEIKNEIRATQNKLLSMALNSRQSFSAFIHFKTKSGEEGVLPILQGVGAYERTENGISSSLFRLADTGGTPTKVIVEDSCMLNLIFLRGAVVRRAVHNALAANQLNTNIQKAATGLENKSLNDII